jgi:hypothetical protein
MKKVLSKAVALAPKVRAIRRKGEKKGRVLFFRKKGGVAKLPLLLEIFN